jgi:hypothetical protein
VSPSPRLIFHPLPGLLCLEWAIRLQSIRRILCCWSLLDCLCQYPKPSLSASHLAWRLAETRPLSSCPAFLGKRCCCLRWLWGLPRHTQTDRHAERCSRIHGRKHRHSAHRHKQVHVIIQRNTLHSPEPNGCRVRSDYAVQYHMVGQWDEFYLSVGRKCDIL